ncbi:hypothetical protein NFI96_020446, partial [Prochilodus magdalenae]
MKVSVVLIWLCLSFVQLRRLDDQHALANSVQSDVWTELKELKVQLQSSQSQIEELKEQNAALEERVASAERGVDTLKGDSTWRPKVAFTFASGLYGYLGPLNGNAILPFRSEITNVGHAYNPISVALFMKYLYSTNTTVNCICLRMRVSLVLLWFCLSGAQLKRGDDQLTVEYLEGTELDTNQTNIQPDVWAELKELRDMVVEQRVQLQCSQGQIEALKRENGVISSRLMASESQVEKLKQDNSDMNNRLLASEGQVEELKVENTAINSKMVASENQVEELKGVISALEGRVVATELGVNALREENANTPKVAFSFASGLNDFLGPFSSDVILVFSKEITNIGNAFSPI